MIWAIGVRSIRKNTAVDPVIVMQANTTCRTTAPGLVNHQSMQMRIEVAHNGTNKQTNASTRGLIPVHGSITEGSRSSRHPEDHGGGAQAEGKARAPQKKKRGVCMRSEAAYKENYTGAAMPRDNFTTS